jgi:Tir chaperone protein (CesT) family
LSTSAENVESMLFRSGAPFDQIDPTTWVLRLENNHRSRVIVKIAEPIVLFSVPLGTLDDSIGNREALYRTLLEFNADFMHSAYAIEGERVVLSGALQTENLDANEFQAIIDDLTMTLDQHLDKLADWKLGTRPTVEA